VRTLVQKPTTRVFRGKKGSVSGFKKAYVVLNKGHFIDFNKPVSVISE
jgi:ribosomal protein L23